MSQADRRIRLCPTMTTSTRILAVTTLLVALTNLFIVASYVVDAAPQQIASTSDVVTTPSGLAATAAKQTTSTPTTTTTTTNATATATGAQPMEKTKPIDDKNQSSSTGEPVDGSKSHYERLNLKPATKLGAKADLTRLINETLVINNRTLETSPFKDEWTFDMVEYDLMEFLQDLGARYQSSAGANKSAAAVAAAADDDEQIDRSDKASPSGAGAASSASSEGVPMKAHMITDTIVNGAPGESKPVEANGGAINQLSKSNDNVDHAIAESSWQYGIFDRFTRARTTSTTPVPSDLIPSNFRPHVSMDARDYNHNECGLRTYEIDDELRSAYPQQAADEQQQQQQSEQAIKELKQRRQRPPPFNAMLGHRKHQSNHVGLASSASSSSSSSSSSSDLMNDSYLAASSSSGASMGASIDATGYSNGAYDDQPAPSSLESVGDNEFNLSSRRQWLQQQLGNTLQVLGYNGTSVSQLNNVVDLSELYDNSTHSDRYLGGGGGGGDGGDEYTLARANKAAKAAHMNAPISADELAARQDELKLEARVIGGSDARLGDSPWSVSLQALVSRPGTGGVEYRHYCGGTIISENYVLTAAHCLDFMVGRESRLFVVVGDLNWRMSAASVHGRRFGIEKLIIHSGYKSTAFGHDIGLIRTKESMRPVKAGGRYIINSVCLPERNVEHTGEAELVGWGLFSNRNEMADALQIVDVPILPRPLCVDLYRRRTGLIQWLIGIELITDKQVCAGTFGRGICQGDSGSALVHNERVEPRAYDRAEDSLQAEGKASATGSVRLKAPRVRESQMRATIIGVVAFGGIRRCSYQSLPGVYMQTSKYMDWILPRIQ